MSMVATVAKKKAKPVEPVAPAPRGMVVGLRGSTEWKDWLNRLSEHRRLSMTDVIDQALVDYANKHGFEPPPKR